MFELVNAIRENFQRKLKTPLLSMFVGVFFVHHWRLFFLPFSFGEMTWEQRQEALAIQFALATDWLHLLCLLWWSIIAVFVTYFAMLISKLIVLIFENIALPNLNRLIRSKTYTKEEYEAIEHQNTELRNQVRNLTETAKVREAQISEKERTIENSNNDLKNRNKMFAERIETMTGKALSTSIELAWVNILIELWKLRPGDNHESTLRVRRGLERELEVLGPKILEPLLQDKIGEISDEGTILKLKELDLIESVGKITTITDLGKYVTEFLYNTKELTEFNLSHSKPVSKSINPNGKP